MKPRRVNKMLSNKDLALLANKLQVPVVVTDILDGKGVFTDDVQYGLHEVISDFQPDSALLSIALSARKIAYIYEPASPSMKVMVMECERIIEEYGELWLKNARHETLNDDDVFDVLIHTTEDLEALAELLELNGSFLRAKDAQASALCDILYIQAQSHALIADTFMAAAEDKAEEPAIDAQKDMPVIEAARSAIVDNVIQFPGGRV